MPSPRFQRLPDERRAAILAVARRHLARDGEACSYNAIVAEVGISKTSAYLYFDGKDDLVRAVYQDLAERLRQVIGSWEPTPSPRAFWDRLEATSDALQAHLLAHPDDLGLLSRGAPSSSEQEFDEAWFSALVRDGIRHGIVRQDVPEPLLVAATRAVFRVLDADALKTLASGGTVDTPAAFGLLRGLWQGPSRQSKGRRS
jgi:AcrR family transcriptional regulator